MKKYITCLITAFLLLIFNLTSFSSTETILVYLNGQQLSFDVNPQIINDRTLVPMRAIFENLNASVEWNESSKTIIATKENKTIKMQIDNNEMIVNGKTILLDVSPTVINDRTLVPVRAIAESLEAEVLWCESIKSVVINTDLPTYQDYPNVIDYGKFMGTNLAKQGSIQDIKTYSYGVDKVGNINNYYKALEKIGYKLTDNNKIGTIQTSVFLSTSNPITKVTVSHIPDIKELRLEIKVDGYYNTSLPLTIKNTFTKTNDGLYLYEDASGNKFIKCSELAEKLRTIKSKFYILITKEDGTWELYESYSEKTLSKGEYKLFDRSKYIDAQSYINYISPNLVK